MIDQLADATAYLETALSEYLNACNELSLTDDEIKDNVLDILVSSGVEL